MIIAFDSETERFRPGMMAPELVCLSWQALGHEPRIARWDTVQVQFADWFRLGHTFVGHNVQYDFAVLGANFPDLVPEIFRAYEEDRVTDTMWRQKLLDISAGGYRGIQTSDGRFIPRQYDLASITKRLTGRVLDKDQTLRTSYGSLRNVLLEDWPEAARIYPLEDARATLDCYLAQEAHKEFLDDQFRQARAYWALHLMSCWGLRTKQEMVDQLRNATEDEIKRVQGRLISEGLVRPDSTRDTKRAQARMEDVMATAGRPLRVTPTGKPTLDSEACEASEDPVLEDYSSYTTLNKVLSNDVPAMAMGITMPIHAHYDLAGTGRTTCSKPNVQNLRRLPGVREAYVPREGFVFIDTDYNALELWSLAQMQIYLFGHSVLAEVLNGGRDPHTALAADLMGLTYEEAAKKKKENTDHEFSNARQTGKVANFGFPGGLGAEKFIYFAKKSYDVTLDPVFEVALQKAQALRQAWFNRWPEMQEYFLYVNSLMEGRLATVKIPVANQLRAGCTFTAACNTMFQGLAAASAKHAGWLIAKACYVDRSSPLFGSRPVVFVHDQYITETPDGHGAHDAAQEQARLMREAARHFMPDCVPGVEPLLSRFWSKDAVALIENGRLTPWPKAA